MRRWKSLWTGPRLAEIGRPFTAPSGIEFGYRWESTGLFGLDQEDRAWTLCCDVTGSTSAPSRWLLVDELMGVQS